MIEISFQVAFVVMFLHVTTWKGEIFGFVSGALKNWPEKIKKPLFACPICMCPWWGSVILFTGQHFNNWQLSLSGSVFILFGAAGINSVLLYVIEFCKEGYKNYKKINDATR